LKGYLEVWKGTWRWSENNMKKN